MRCPLCGYNDSKVTDSREADDGIRRRRECLSCGRRFTTFERVQSAHMMVVKKDGRREEFSREKVREGIQRSVAKLAVSAAEVNAIVDEIEASLLARGTPEVPAGEVGDVVMDSLRELNYAAYVRFASHYKDFVNLEELQAEVERGRTAPRRSPRRAGAAQPPLLPPAALDKPVNISDRPARRASPQGKQDTSGSKRAARR
jgi:transcriptional repressor NrdR